MYVNTHNSRCVGILLRGLSDSPDLKDARQRDELKNCDTHLKLKGLRKYHQLIKTNKKTKQKPSASARWFVYPFAFIGPVYKEKLAILSTLSGGARGGLV